MKSLVTQSKVARFVSGAAVAVIMGTTGLVGTVQQAAAGPNELQAERGYGYATPLRLRADGGSQSGSSHLRGRVGYLSE